MKKTILTFTLIIGLFLLSGCGAKNENVSVSQQEPEPTQPESTSLVMIENSDFELAEYEKFNSPASENGLAGTNITFQGKIKEFCVENDFFYYIVETKDGDWNVGLGFDYSTERSRCEELVGKDAQIFATYTGFSYLVNLPACSLLADTANGGVFDERMKIVLADGTEYLAIPYFWDWNKVLESQEYKDIYNGMTASSSVQGSSSSTAQSGDNGGANSTSEKETAITTEQYNAQKAASNYLKVSAFSRTGLIEQLEYEGYSTEAATRGVDLCGVDWNVQAAKSAKAYLDIMAFSRQGLIDQLVYSGFTAEQAEYGAAQNGY